MLATQRRDAILRELRLRGTVRISDLSRRLGVSVATLRRDVTELADEGLVERVHGGAAAVQRPAGDGGPGAPSSLAAVAALGVVVPQARYYFDRVLQGMREAAAELGVRLVLGVSDYDGDLEREHVRRTLALGVDGLLVAPADVEERDPHTYAMLRAVDVPVVIVERGSLDLTVGPALDHVRSDHAAGIQRALGHLAALGHERVAVAVNPLSVTATWLVEGFTAAAARFAPGHAERVVRLPRLGSPAPVLGAALDALLDRCAAEGITAVVAHPDEYAMALADLAALRGVAVPGGLSVVAYDDEVAELGAPPLTAVSPPKHDVGREAVRLVVDRVLGGGRSRGSSPQLTTLLPELVVRESTGPADPRPSVD
ncbi:LacI family DNA-binding transcriptional regulator [Xylanimonas protaetiae]|uniref:DeoR family transcriptional regulator n=1 Tax=Xylanimonas protaetiae TaxID=2509457 RepID=A0A4P6F6W2_9MICO|nr:LacI family DNA-binding transcriptional regulator [Xylanimonas protaetiae]QAY71195.1 DeoR family transcriptional regulator [Xylanimonas protaetiae]